MKRFLNNLWRAVHAGQRSLHSERIQREATNPPAIGFTPRVPHDPYRHDKWEVEVARERVPGPLPVGLALIGEWRPREV